MLVSFFRRSFAPFCVNNCVCFLFSHSAIYDVVEEKADSEPDFQYIPEKSPQDPTQLDQHALRDSMVVLKEGLGSGAILAQFDVRLRNEHKQKHTWLLSVHTTVGECCLESEVWLNNEYFVIPALNLFVLLLIKSILNSSVWHKLAQIAADAVDLTTL